MATFNIIGCCVSRDILGFMPYSAHKTLRFLQFSTPASYLLYHDKPPKLLTVEELNERLGG